MGLPVLNKTRNKPTRKQRDRNSGPSNKVNFVWSISRIINLKQSRYDGQCRARMPLERMADFIQSEDKNFSGSKRGLNSRVDESSAWVQIYEHIFDMKSEELDSLSV